MRKINGRLAAGMAVFALSGSVAHAESGWVESTSRFSSQQPPLTFLVNPVPSARVDWDLATEPEQAFGTQLVPLLRTNTLTEEGVVADNGLDDDGYGQLLGLHWGHAHVAYDGPQDHKAAHFNGGFSWTVPHQRWVSQGGAIAFSDLTLDLYAGTLLADVSYGGNTLQDVALWQGDGVLDFSGEVYRVDHLRLTAAGADALINGLRLSVLGRAALEAAPSYGSLTVSIPAVPEPSTVMLLMAGLGLLTILARRR